MDVSDFEKNCLICHNQLDERKTSIHEKNILSGKRLLIKIFEVTKLDFPEGFLCCQCNNIITSIESLENEFNSTLDKARYPENKFMIQSVAVNELEDPKSKNNEDLITSQQKSQDENELLEERNIKLDFDLDGENISKEFNEDIKLENNPKIDMDLDSLADEEETEKNFHEQEIQEEQRDLNEMLHKLKSKRRKLVDKNKLEEEYDKSQNFQCLACGKIYNSKSLLLQHLSNLTGKKDEAGKSHDGKCAHCRESFENWDDHKRHIDLKHEGVLKFRCGYCENHFTDRRIYLNHILTVKNRCKQKLEAYKGKELICPTCGKTCYKESLLKNHIANIHEAKGKFECQKCGLVVTSRAKLKAHMLNYHDPYTCDECGKQFHNKLAFVRHVEHNHKSMEDRPYKCQTCPKGFFQERTLSYHENIHTGNRPFQCKVCEKSFPDPSTLLQHEKRVHLGIRKTKKQQKADKIQS